MNHKKSSIQVKGPFIVLAACSFGTNTLIRIDEGSVPYP